MTRRSFLGDMLTTLFERGGRASAPTDERSLEDLCRALLDAEGEVSGLGLASTILDRYARLTEAEKAAFFNFLNDGLEIDIPALTQALSGYGQSRAVSDYRQVGRLAEPPRQELLRRLNQPPGATQALVNMRNDLLSAVKQNPELMRTDLDFQHLLRSWFNRGFLVLRQISWDTAASILEKIVEYEAVHAIGDWDDLRRRLQPKDRRCFAYFHPAMPEEPLIFVEVALTTEIPGSIRDVLTDKRREQEAHETSVAVFYSISNCQRGLAGISFGNLLIKQVVGELRQELPQLDTFVTLSPIPRLRAWLEQATNDDDARAVLAGTAEEEAVRVIAADYLLKARDGQQAPFDPVARFHLGNGAQIHAVHGAADLSENGLWQSGGAMVNYLYDLKMIEQNHERFVQKGEICVTPAFQVAHAATVKKRKRT